MASSGYPSWMQDEEGILFVQMGGTIDKHYPHKVMGYAFEIDEAAAARIVTVCRKDSLDINDDDRESLFAALIASEARRFVVSHGTDTMIETARYVSSRLAATRPAEVWGFVVVFTGALLPERFKGSDAEFNVGCAVGAAQSCAPGVYIAMSGRIIPADECLRDEATGGFLKARPSASTGPPDIP